MANRTDCHWPHYAAYRSDCLSPRGAVRRAAPAVIHRAVPCRLSHASARFASLYAACSAGHCSPRFVSYRACRLLMRSAQHCAADFLPRCFNIYAAPTIACRSRGLCSVLRRPSFSALCGICVNHHSALRLLFAVRRAAAVVIPPAVVACGAGRQY